MSVTLSGLSGLQDPEVRSMIALNADEHITSITSSASSPPRPIIA